MNEIRIKVQCTENEHHAKILRISSALGREYAEGLAGLLDGTSRFYIHKPGGVMNVPEWPGDKGSPIGRCGICGAPFRCSVFEITEGGGDANPDLRNALRDSLDEAG